eukprot:gene17534-23853_t
MKPIYKLQDVSADMKHQIVYVFNSEWGGAIVYTVDLLEKTWMRTEKDVLLVMIDPDSGDLIGTIGLDHKYRIPIAGHLYTRPSQLSAALIAMCSSAFAFSSSMIACLSDRITSITKADSK